MELSDFPTTESRDHTTLLELIESSAARAYATAAEEHNLPLDDIHRARLCHEVAAVMVASLVESGVNATVETRGGWTVDSHSFGVILDADGTETIADPTWMQFLPVESTPTTPRVLTGSREEVVGTLARHGVDVTTQALWAPKTS